MQTVLLNVQHNIYCCYNLVFYHVLDHTKSDQGIFLINFMYVKEKIP
jgi:hypothetical protein